MLNKCDRVTAAERQRLERFLWQVNPDAGYLAVSLGDLDPLSLETTHAHDGASQDITPGWMHLLSGTSLSEDEHNTETFVYRAKRPFHPFRFWLLMQEEWPGVLRSKGYFWVASQPKTCYMWSQAGANCLYERLGRWWVAIPDQHWPKEEAALQELRKVWDLEFGDRRIELAFIGEQIDRVRLKRQLDACLLTRAELALEEQLWRAFRDPFKKPSWENGTPAPHSQTYCRRRRASRCLVSKRFTRQTGLVASSAICANKVKAVMSSPASEPWTIWNGERRRERAGNSVDVVRLPWRSGTAAVLTISPRIGDHE